MRSAPKNVQSRDCECALYSFICRDSLYADQLGSRPDTMEIAKVSVVNDNIEPILGLPHQPVHGGYRCRVHREETTDRRNAFGSVYVRIGRERQQQVTTSHLIFNHKLQHCAHPVLARCPPVTGHIRQLGARLRFLDLLPVLVVFVPVVHRVVGHSETIASGVGIASHVRAVLPLQGPENGPAGMYVQGLPGLHLGCFPPTQQTLAHGRADTLTSRPDGDGPGG